MTRIRGNPVIGEGLDDRAVVFLYRLLSDALSTGTQRTIHIQQLLSTVPVRSGAVAICSRHGGDGSQSKRVELHRGWQWQVLRQRVLWAWRFYHFPALFVRRTWK